MTDFPLGSKQLSRRTFIAATIAGGLALAACSRPASPKSAGTSGDAIAAAEAACPHTGPP
jgi:hypothetical protein